MSDMLREAMCLCCCELVFANLLYANYLTSKLKIELHTKTTKKPIKLVENSNTIY